VATHFTFSDGSRHPGFVTPTYSDEGFKIGHLGDLSPNVFTDSEQRFLLWFGMSNEYEAIAKFYDAFGKTKAEVFPIRFETLPGLTTELAWGEIPW